MTILQSSFSNQNSFGSSQRSSVAVWAPVLFLVNHGEDSKRRDWFWLMCLEVQVSDDCVASQALRRSRTPHREKQQLYSPLSPFPKKIQSCGSTLMGPSRLCCFPTPHLYLHSWLPHNKHQLQCAFARGQTLLSPYQWPAWFFSSPQLLIQNIQGNSRWKMQKQNVLF